MNLQSLIYNIENLSLYSGIKNEIHFSGWMLEKNFAPLEINIIINGIKYNCPLKLKRPDIHGKFASNTLNHHYGFDEKIKADNEINDLLIQVTNLSSKETITIPHELTHKKKGITYNIDDISWKKTNGCVAFYIEGWALNNNDELPVNITITSNKSTQQITPKYIRKDLINLFELHESHFVGFKGVIYCSKIPQKIKISFYTQNSTLETIEFLTEEVRERSDTEVDFKESYQVKRLKNIPKFFYKKEINFIKEITKSTFKSITKKSSFKKEISFLKNYRENYLDKYIDSIENISLINNNISFNDYFSQINTPNDTQINLMAEKIKLFKHSPKISIVMPVYNVEEEYLNKAINSILNQVYQNWELCLSDDKSTKYNVPNQLRSIEKKDNRIKVILNKENRGISDATNAAIKIATGDFILFMDNDDELSSNALYEIARAINTDSSIDVLYSDEDKIDENNNHYDFNLKPIFSPELLLSFNYINHFFCVRKKILDKAGILDSSLDGSQDYDIILRVSRITNNFHHIPKVLYHWRAIEGSIAKSGVAKNSSFNFFKKGELVLQKHLDAIGVQGKAFHSKFAKKNNLGAYAIKYPNQGKKVSILIPTKNLFEDIKKCITSILEKTTYENYEIIVLDNESDEQKTIEYLNEISLNPKISIHKIKNKDHLFNFSYINNYGVQLTKGDYILFLNNDTEVINPNWLSSMVGNLEHNGVGIVGAKLLYPDGTIQHAGVINGVHPDGFNRLPDHAFKKIEKNKITYGFASNFTRNYSSVTGACLLIRKKTFLEVGGFDEDNFGLAYNDIDLCLRVLKLNKRIVYDAQAELYHYESKTRKDILNINEVSNFRNKYKNFEDPYYPKLFSKENYFTIHPFNITSDSVKDEKKTILIFTHNLNLEGAPLQIFEIVNGLKDKTKWEFIIASPIKGPLMERYQNVNCKIIIYEESSILMDHNEQKSLNDIQKVIIENKPDAIFANTLLTYNAIYFAEKLKIPAIWCIHESSKVNDFFSHLPNKLIHEIKSCFYKTYATVFVAKATKHLYNEYNSLNNSIVINNGASFPKKNYLKSEINKNKLKINIPKDSHNFLNLGTVCSRKGQLDFVNAALILLKENKNCFFTIVGARRKGTEQEYINNIEKLIKLHNAEDHFLIIDETNDVDKYYSSADSFVCSSYNESYPRVILEAMSYGLPIITTPIFGIIEQVIEKVNAEFYVPGNINQLFAHMKEFINNENKITEYSKNSHQVLQISNSYEDMINDYFDLLGGALNS